MVRWVAIALQSALLLTAAGLGYAARDPMLAAIRPWPLAGAIAAVIACTLVAAVAWRLGGGRSRLSILIAAVSLPLALTSEGRFQVDRWRVLSASPVEVAELGSHLIVSFRRIEDVIPLIERGAIGGIFITTHNVQGRRPAEIAGDIARLQAIQRRHGRPPLWVAADQEGGLVARLSPPLPRQPSLSTFAPRGQPVRTEALASHARAQASGLARLGVNLNFAPVVDLDFAIVDPADRHTRIAERAIASGAGIVGEVARSYCGELWKAGVRCTLKHFPGLGRVRGDTHRDSASLPTPIAELQAADWRPFRETLQGPGQPAIMLAHVTLTAIDAEVPASASPKIIRGLLRQAWGHDGLLVTDDLCMGAVYYGALGLRGTATEALAAGVDLLLVSWDGAQYFKVMSALLAARRDGRLTGAQLAASRARLAKYPPAELTATPR